MYEEYNNQKLTTNSVVTTKLYFAVLIPLNKHLMQIVKHTCI